MIRTFDTHFQRGPKAVRGFTLLELMIAVIVISILATIANVSYQDSVVRTRRAAAKVCLIEASQFMERFYTTNQRYDTARDDSDVPDPVCAAGTDVTTFYTVTLAAVNASTYRLTAVPQGAQATKDTECATLGIDQIGNRSKTGTGTVDDCW